LTFLCFSLAPRRPQALVHVSAPSRRPDPNDLRSIARLSQAQQPTMDSDIMEDSAFDDFDNESDAYSPEVVRCPPIAFLSRAAPMCQS
jgi:hypothetical protein